MVDTVVDCAGQLRAHWLVLIDQLACVKELGLSVLIVCLTVVL